MSTALGLAMQISANTAQLATAVSDVNAKLDAMGTAGKKAADDLGSLKSIEIAKLALGGITAATKAFVGLTTSIIGATQSLAAFGLSIADKLDSLNDVSNRTGIGVEALQAYGVAAKLAGTDVETFAKSIQKLSVNIGNATDEKSAKKFTALGISFEELKAAAPTEQFEMVADAISKIQDPAERAAAAVKVFGKGGIELGPLFSEGPGALARMREEAQSLGMVVSAETVKSIGTMNDAFDKVWMTVKGLTGQIVGELAGPIATIAEDLLNVVRQAGATNIAQNIAGGLLDFIQMAGNSFFRLAEFIEAFVKKFGPILGIDIRSEAEKELERLRGEAKMDAMTGRNAAVDGFGRPLADAAGIAQASRDRDQKIADLEAEVAASASGGAINRFRDGFNASINQASASLERRMQPPTTPDSTVDVRMPDAVTQESADETNRLLKELVRKSQPARVVEIAR